MEPNTLKTSLFELIRRTSAEMPKDVLTAITRQTEKEAKGSRARYAMDIVCENIKLAKSASAPICQDTGSILFYVKAPVGFDQVSFENSARWAVEEATKKGYLRQNSVDPITGKNSGNNLGPGFPTFHFEQLCHSEPKAKDLTNINVSGGSFGLRPKDDTIDVRLILKGGGCENCGVQYSLPNKGLNAERDLDGVKKCLLDCVLQAQGKGCGPGILGVCVGGDRSTGFAHSKEQLLRTLDDANKVPELARLEKEVTEISNKLDIGPMGFGGATTLLGCKIGARNRVPASFFVSISYMCWANRRQGVKLDKDGKIEKWLY